jgi:hypothetical protein
VRAVQNTLLIVAALVVGFALAEVAARLLYRPGDLRSVIRFDPMLGWSLDPGASSHSVSSIREFDYHIAINSLGLREREITVNKPPGTRRVLVIGDSFVFGPGVEAEWRATDIMNRALGDDVEVINAGVSGWGTDQELVFYENSLRRLEPDVVVVCVMAANDVINNMLDHLFLNEKVPKPRFSMENGTLRWSGPIDRPPPLRPTVRSVLRKSRLLLWAKRSADVVFARPEGDKGVAAESGLEMEWKRHRGYSHWMVYENARHSQLDEGWRMTGAILRRFADVCEEDGTEFIVMAFPLKIEVQDEWRQRLFERAGVRPQDLDLTLPYRRLRGICEANGIEFLYPLEAFREGAAHRDLYFRLDGHPNRFGHVMAARVLLDELNTHNGYRFEIRDVDQPHFTALR